MITRMVRADGRGEIAGAGQGLAVDGDDDVTGLKADLAGRRARHDLLDEGAGAVAGRARGCARRPTAAVRAYLRFRHGRRLARMRVFSDRGRTARREA